jgi:predicted nucleic acid-binding protein
VPDPRGLIDTSVIIGIEDVEPALLPDDMTIAAVTLAELAAGPHATNDPLERGRRQDRLQRAEAILQALPFDADAARAYGRVYAALVVAGRKARGRRARDLLIAATALANDLPLYTRNPDDFMDLGSLVRIVTV